MLVVLVPLVFMLSPGESAQLSDLPETLWFQTLSFVKRLDTEIYRIDRKTYSFYESALRSMRWLETLDLSSASQVDCQLVCNLTEQLNFEHLVTKRKQNLINKVLRASIANMTLHKHNLLNALGVESMDAVEYHQLTLHRMADINLTCAAKSKLKLLILASRATHYHQTSRLCAWADGNLMAELRNDAGYRIAILIHFPWISMPRGAAHWSGAYLLYFDFLFEFLWQRFSFELGLPRLESVCYVTHFDADWPRMAFLRYLIRSYRLKVGDPDMSRVWRQNVFNATRFQSNDEHEFAWLVMEADRITKLALLHSDDWNLFNAFITDFVIQVSEFVDLNGPCSADTPALRFVVDLLQKLIRYNSRFGKRIEVECLVHILNDLCPLYRHA